MQIPFCLSYIQKQPFADVPQNRYSQKFRNVHRKTTLQESLFNKIAVLKACNLIKKKFQQRCFLVNIAKYQDQLFL